MRIAASLLALIVLWPIAPASAQGLPPVGHKDFPTNGGPPMWNRNMGPFLMLGSVASNDPLEYCVDTVNNSVCDTSWIPASSSPVALAGLSPATTYYWQVRARNSTGVTEFDGGQWWSFAMPPLPTAFQKLAPANGTGPIDPAMPPTLTWTASANVEWYELCISHDSDCRFSPWFFNITATSYDLANLFQRSLDAGFPYYWEIRARNASGYTYADSGAFWVFTTDVLRGTLTIAIQGSGTVTTDDGFIQCPPTCSHRYLYSQPVTLHAAPAPGFTFAGYPEPLYCTPIAAAVDRTCTATFLPRATAPPTKNNLSLAGSGFGDIFTYNPTTGARESYFSDGSGGFTRVRGQWSAGWQVAAADFNGDGLSDLFLYSPVTGQWYKAINDGAGDFTYVTGQWSAGWQIYVLDFDHDGRSDVFVYNPRTGDWSRCMTTGSGAGQFAYSAGRWNTGWQIYPADINADGRADLFLYNPVLGWWTDAIDDGHNGFTYFAGGWSAGWQVTTGDFDGNHSTDMFLYSPATGEWYVAYTGAALLFNYSHGRWPSGLVIHRGNFDGNARDDLFAYDPGSGSWFEAISGAPSVISPTGSQSIFSYAGGIWDGAWNVQVTDLNGDGKSDIVLSNNSLQAYQGITTGAGTFTFRSTTSLFAPGSIMVATMPSVP